jgi:hypothetical protein
MHGRGAAWMVALLALPGCAPPAVLRQPPGGPEMAIPLSGAAVPVTRLAEPTGDPPITLPDREPSAPGRPTGP